MFHESPNKYRDIMGHFIFEIQQNLTANLPVSRASYNSTVEKLQA